MKDLIDIISFIKSENNIHESDVQHSLKNSPAMHKLFNAVYSENLDNEEDLILLLYGKSKNRRTFNELRRRLVNKLYDIILLHSPSLNQLSDAEIAYNQCSKYLHISRILYSKNYRELAIELAQKVRALAQKYDFVEYSFLAEKLMIIPTGVYTGDSGLIGQMLQSTQQNLKTLSAEIEAESLYAQIMSHHAQSQESLSKETIDHYANKLNLIESTFANIHSTRFLRLLYMIRISLAELSFNVPEVIYQSRKAINYFQSKPYFLKNTIFGFEIRLMSAYVRLNKVNDVEPIYQKYHAKLEEGSSNWYILNLYYIFHLLYSKNYDRSLKIISSALKNQHFHYTSPNRKEIWFILEAYMHLLLACGKISPETAKRYPLRQFRLYRFLNDVPIFSKDKRGINITILIIHILFLLKQRKHDKICDRVDALKQYSRRYLRRDENFRSNCFIKLLVLLPKTGFNRQRTERHAKDLIAKLHSMPLAQTRQGIETEPMPYEHLWDMTIEMLD